MGRKTHRRSRRHHKRRTHRKRSHRRTRHMRGGWGGSIIEEPQINNKNHFEK